MLIATAGHIDHGKTSLVRALTGVETDRLPEERARGISIDLGFAYWPSDDGGTIGFVDVPGHERFVRNMLAGVAAIDFALLVVAADDGVMPQTVEHLQILDLLGVARGIAVITKCDRVGRERIDAVRAQVRQLLARSTLADAPLVDVSTVTGDGIDALQARLQEASKTLPQHLVAGRNFRLAIDRAFTVTGVGTVVTGTVFDGALETGARLMLTPRGREVRVRGLQSGGHAVSRIRAGQRCAVNLAGIEVAEISRGDWLLAPSMHAPTSRLEASLRVLPGRADALKHNATVHLHLGTADLTARVLAPAQAGIAPGASAVVRLVLDQPTVAVTGDRFVLRDQSGRQLLGGGRVIDPFVGGERRSAASRAPVTAALQLPDAAEALAALLATAGHEIDTLRFERCFNLEPAAAAELYRQAGAVLLGSTHTLALPAARVAALGDEIVAALKAHHQSHPEAGGMTPRDLKARLATPVSAAAFLSIQRELTEKRLIESGGPLVKLAGHTATFSAADNALWQKAQRRLERRGAQPFTARDLAGELAVSEVIVKALLYGRRGSGDVWRITETRFMLRRQIAALAAAAAVVAREVGGKGFTAAQYRDAIGTGRTLAIQILEFFDTIGVTLRNGDLRRMRPDYELVVGASAPYVPGA